MFLVSFVLLSLGAFTSGTILYRLSSFVYLHYLHNTTIQRFAQKDSYALVTGSSGGLGLALCETLYDRGFNLVIHGRSLEKLHVIRKELNARPSPKRDIQCFITDGSSTSWEFAPLKAFKITTLFLCAGGSVVKHLRLDGLSDADVDAVINFNALFPLSLTKYILPNMRATGLPLLIVAIGSQAATMTPPYVSMYASSKAFLRRWILCLDADEKFTRDPSSDITIHYMSSGEFSSSVNKTISFMCPSSSTMAKAVIGCVGCGMTAFLPHVGHDIQALFMELIGETITGKIVNGIMRKKYFTHQKKD